MYRLLFCLASLVLCAQYNVRCPEDFENARILHTHERTGTTWTLYCIQALTGFPIFLTRNKELVHYKPFRIDLSAAPVFHTHFPSYVEKIPSNENDLIITVRDYQEVFVRLAKRSADDRASEEKHIQSLLDAKKHKHFLETLKVYDNWNPKRRHLIYYEDLMLDPKTVLEKLLLFLGEDTIQLDYFMSKIATHRKRSLNVYAAQQDRAGGPMSKGIDLKFHTKNIAIDIRLKAQSLMQSLAGPLWDKYLTRYTIVDDASEIDSLDIKDK